MIPVPWLVASFLVPSGVLSLVGLLLWGADPAPYTFDPYPSPALAAVSTPSPCVPEGELEEARLAHAAARERYAEELAKWKRKEREWEQARTDGVLGPDPVTQGGGSGLIGPPIRPTPPEPPWLCENVLGSTMWGTVGTAGWNQYKMMAIFGVAGLLLGALWKSFRSFEAEQAGNAEGGTLEEAVAAQKRPDERAGEKAGDEREGKQEKGRE